jgi:hypothetical protein
MGDDLGPPDLYDCPGGRHAGATALDRSTSLSASAARCNAAGTSTPHGLQLLDRRHNHAVSVLDRIVLYYPHRALPLSRR